MGWRGLTEMAMTGEALDLLLHGRRGDPRDYLRAFGYDPPPYGELAGTAAVDAEVNHGIWIWRCPCGLGSPEDPPSAGGVVFVSRPIGWCPRCQNASVDGGWRPIRLPPERERIEAALDARADPATRNWGPSETVAELLAENAAHRIEGG